MATADYLQVFAVVSACCVFLNRRLHPSNCLGIVRYTEQVNRSTLLKTATLFTSRHFTQVSHFQEMVEFNPEQLGALLASDDLCVNSEEDVFNALVIWLEHDSENRLIHIPELMKHNRMQLPNIEVR